MLAQAKEQRASLVGPGDLLNQLTKNVLETALNPELTEYLGHEHGGTPLWSNMRNGTRTKTVLTEIGPVGIEVTRDRDGSFGPVSVPKRKRRLDGVDQIVLSLTVPGADDRGDRRALRRDLWRVSLQGHGQPDHGEGHQRTRRMGGRDCEVAPPGLYGSVRGRGEGPVRGRVRWPVSGDRAALVPLLGRVRAVLGVRRRDPPSDLPDQCDRVDQCPLPARHPSARALPQEAAALKCLYLVTRSLDPTGSGRTRWVMRWKPALNAFAITFAGRFERTTH